MNDQKKEQTSLPQQQVENTDYQDLDNHLRFAIRVQSLFTSFATACTESLLFAQAMVYTFLH